MPESMFFSPRRARSQFVCGCICSLAGCPYFWYNKKKSGKGGGMMGNEWIMRACAQAEREGGRSMKHEAQKIGKNRAANRAVPSACPSRSECRKLPNSLGAEWLPTNEQASLTCCAVYHKCYSSITKVSEVLKRLAHSHVFI